MEISGGCAWPGHVEASGGTVSGGSFYFIPHPLRTLAATGVLVCVSTRVHCAPNSSTAPCQLLVLSRAFADVYTLFRFFEFKVLDWCERPRPQPRPRILPETPCQNPHPPRTISQYPPVQNHFSIFSEAFQPYPQGLRGSSKDLPRIFLQSLASRILETRPHLRKSF